MAVGTNRWKLGLFVVLGCGAGIVAIVVFGARSWNDQTVTYVSYFDESVQGLELGSPVKFRGMTIGQVGDIDVAPDRRHIRVDSEILVEHAERLGLDGGRPSTGEAFKLRVQLAQAGITGVKFVLLDYFAPAPAPSLGFATPENTLATMPSTMKNLEDSLLRATDRFPEIASALLVTVEKVNSMLENVEKHGLATRAGTALGEVSAAMVELRTQLKALDAPGLAAQTREDLTELKRTLESANRLLARFESDNGVLDSTERAANSMNEVARGARAVGPELELTLREVRGTAKSLRRFLDALERDPDMLIKGRGERKP
jgi:ABC-type transporter Mla subunit MlaD